MACIEKYKYLVRIIEEVSYYKPPEMDRNEFDLKDDFDKVRLPEKHKTREKKSESLNKKIIDQVCIHTSFKNT